MKRRRYITQLLVQPGKCISINMMTSPTPRFIAQMSGKPTCKRYCHLLFMSSRQPAWDLSAFKSPSTWKIPWKARLHLKDFVKSTGSPFSTTMLTMGSSPPIHEGNCAYNKDRASPLPESQHIIRMALQRGRSGNLKRCMHNAHPHPSQVAKCHHPKSLAICTMDVK